MSGKPLERYDGVILAAGRNTRLKGVIPSYYKPLMIVNGRPLIVSLVRNMKPVCRSINVVVSPENCGPIVEILDANGLLDQHVNLIVQPQARGPGDGLFRALQSCHAPRILLICGDNSVPPTDIINAVIADSDHEGTYKHNLVTVSTMLTSDDAEAIRFTRISSNKKTFIENTPGGRGWSDGYYHCWVGPLIFDREVAYTLFGARVSSYRPGDPEVKISVEFNRLELVINPVAGHSIDIGTSDALLRMEE